MGTINCTGEDDCPLCQELGERGLKKPPEGIIPLVEQYINQPSENVLRMIIGWTKREYPGGEWWEWIPGLKPCDLWFLKNEDLPERLRDPNKEDLWP